MLSRFLARRGRKVASGEVTYLIRELPPIDQNDIQYAAINTKDLAVWADRYLSAMETEESKNWCRCEWIVHPDDTRVKPGTCRECGGPPSAIVHHGLPEDFEQRLAHHYKGKRMRRGDQASDCPVHTREGFLIYFFTWVFEQR